MTEQITFIEINPGLGSFGFAAERAGAIRLGPVGLSMDVRQAYLDFHGSDSAELIEDNADLVVADLPFSLFLDGKNADPDVTDVVSAARTAIRRGGYALFRVKWDIGSRLNIDPDLYLSVVSAAFPKYAVAGFVDHSGGADPVSTRDLYIMASPEDFGFGAGVPADDPSVTAIHPLILDEYDSNDVDPQQIFSSLGFPEDFHRVAGSVPTLDDRIRESAIISRASAVIETAAVRIRG